MVAFLFGAVILIRLQIEPVPFVGLAAEHGSDHRSDIGLPSQCADLQSCCEQGGGVYCAYNNKRVDEKCCNPGETCTPLSLALGLWKGALCNAAADCPNKCQGKKAFKNIQRCCKPDEDCGTEKKNGAPVCYKKDLSGCSKPCYGEKSGLVDFQGLNICCNENEDCRHNSGAAVCVRKSCNQGEILCNSDPEGGTKRSRNLGAMDDGKGYSLCCGGETPTCVPGTVTSNGRPFCVRSLP